MKKVSSSHAMNDNYDFSRKKQRHDESSYTTNISEQMDTNLIGMKSVIEHKKIKLLRSISTYTAKLFTYLV